MKKMNCLWKFSAGFIILLFLGITYLPAFADGGKKCSDLSKESIDAVLKKLNVPGAEILDSKPSPMAGLCEIVINVQGNAHVIYTDMGLNHLIMGGSLVETKAMTNLTMVDIKKHQEQIQKLQDQKKIDLARISLNEGLTVGGKNAAKKVIVFTDPD